MIILLLVVYVLIAIALIAVVLLQKSEGGALGIGGGGMSSFMTGRSTANLLSRATAILAALFMSIAVLLVVLRNHERAPPSIVDHGAPAAPAVPLAPGAPSPKPAGPPAAPSAPLAR
jgi:preprotein translocase subunit SecG